MLTTRVELLEKLLTDDCRETLAVVDDIVNNITYDDVAEWHDKGTAVRVNMPVALFEGERCLVKSVLEAAGYKDVVLGDKQVIFNF